MRSRFGTLLYEAAKNFLCKVQATRDKVITDVCLRTELKKESGKATLASVKKEMAKPRRAKSAREEEVNLAPARIVRGKRGKTKL